MKSYTLPTRPYSPIDALNRRAAAVGSPGYAQRTANADYNGHNVGVSWNSYRGYYIAEYFWGERVVLARGSFSTCFGAAVRYYDKGALGASVSIHPREDDNDALRLIEDDPRIVDSDADKSREDWYSWRHQCAAQSVRDYCHPGAFKLVFDWELMEAAASESEYLDALKVKYGNAYT